MKKSLWIALVLLFQTSVFAEQHPLQISIIGDPIVYQSYLQLVEEKGGDPMTISDYRSSYSFRPSISLLLLKQALTLGGLDFEFDFVASTTPARNIRMVKSGSVLLLASDMWISEFDNTVNRSLPVVSKDEFTKGFFVHEDSPLLERTWSLADIREASVLVEKTWYNDIEVLEAHGFSNIQFANRADAILTMVKRGRADFAFFEFPDNQQLAIDHPNGRFLPISDWRVNFQQSRHFMVSKNHPLSEVVSDALDRGMTELQQRGSLHKALEAAGVLNPRVADWRAVPDIQ